MPIIRERRIPPEYIDTYLAKGGCLKRGAEIWFIARKRLQIATVLSIDEGANTAIVIGKDGKSFKLDPMSSIIFVQPHFKIPKDLKAVRPTG